uniref:Uncharacterized protein n=1 Tax=Anguilla anguilla TaxID=7936 RepID=A0A0E9W1W0_ANGAN
MKRADRLHKLVSPPCGGKSREPNIRLLCLTQILRAKTKLVFMGYCMLCTLVYACFLLCFTFNDL